MEYAKLHLDGIIQMQTDTRANTIKKYISDSFILVVEQSGQVKQK